MRRCPYCAEEIQDAAIVCKHCGRQIAEGDVLSSVATPQVLAAAPSAPTPPPEVPLRSKPNIPYLLAGIMFGGIWAIEAGHGDLATYLGAWTGTLIFPSVIAFVVRGRKGDWRSFSRWFFWLALLFTPLLTTMTRGSRP